MVGTHLVKSWSSTQNLVSLSSGEAEYYGVVKAAGVGLGYRALLHDIGIDLPVRVWTDSTASIGICGRQGLGKLRHLDTNCLWVQQRVRDKSFELRKVKGTENPADLFTKYLPSANVVEHLLKLFGCEFRDGRAESAPQLRAGSGTEAGESLLKVSYHPDVPTEEVLDEEIEVDGHLYQAVRWEGEKVAEAQSYGLLKLPHEHGADLVKMFPRAVAAPDRGDRDLEPPCGLERRGIALGSGKS